MLGAGGGRPLLWGAPAVPMWPGSVCVCVQEYVSTWVCALDSPVTPSRNLSPPAPTSEATPPQGPGGPEERAGMRTSMEPGSIFFWGAPGAAPPVFPGPSLPSGPLLKAPDHT